MDGSANGQPPLMPPIVVKVAHGSSPDVYHRITLQGHEDFALLSVRIARCLGRSFFKLLLAEQEISSATWPAVLVQARAARSLKLRVVAVSPDLEPAGLVDPFWACEKTSLPQTRGIGAAWYYLKAQTGNTHPGAALPYGMVSVLAYSGAYPTGYGLNAQSSSGAPALMLDGINLPPGGKGFSPDNQYTCTGFAHFQPSGTGSIGNYYK